MHGSRRRMSIRKWKKVEELYRKGKIEEAFELSVDEESCGHCMEFKNRCHECPLGNYDFGYYGCAEVVMNVIDILKGCARYNTRDKRVLPLIRKVQKLVAGK